MKFTLLVFLKTYIKIKSILTLQDWPSFFFRLNILEYHRKTWLMFGVSRANSDIAQVRVKAKQEQAAYQASLRKEQMKVDSLERTLEQKVWDFPQKYKILMKTETCKFDY